MAGSVPRKTKGNKILPLVDNETNFSLQPPVVTSDVLPTPVVLPNIVLNLKCTLSDIWPNSTTSIMTHQHTPHGQTLVHKLKALETQLHNNFCENKHGACFWCTCDFTSTPIHIPKYIMNGTYHVYGHFCSPECAAGYLMNSDIDTSTKFNSYALLNTLYRPIFNYIEQIKPAPNPHYILDKFCGNLTIAEYRELYKLTTKQLFIVDKPLVKLMPELHQDRSDILLYNVLLSKDILGGGGATLSSNNAPFLSTVPPPPKNTRKTAFKALFSKTNSDGTTPL